MNFVAISPLSFGEDQNLLPSSQPSPRGRRRIFPLLRGEGQGEGRVHPFKRGSIHLGRGPESVAAFVPREARCGKVTEKPVVVHVFDGFRVGGTEVRTCGIINALKDAYRHVVVSSTGDFSAAALIDPAIEIQYVHPVQIQGLFRPFALWRIAGMLKSFAPRLMIAYEWGAIDWVMANVFFRACPTLMTIEGFEEAELFAQKRTRLFLRRIFYRRCEKVVACSQTLCRIATQVWGLDSDRVLHIPNGVNCSNFSPALREEKREGVALGIVASLIKLKNHDRLLRSLAELSPFFPLTLHIVGDGPERQRLEAECRALGIAGQVRFTGLLADPAPILQKLDIFCLASDTEQMPLSVLEAMACGLPVVGTDVGDVKEMVAEANKRFIVAPGSADAYTRALRELCADRSLRQELGQANLQRCRELYDEELMCKRYQALYAELTAIRPKRSMRCES